MGVNWIRMDFHGNSWDLLGFSGIERNYYL